MAWLNPQTGYIPYRSFTHIFLLDGALFTVVGIRYSRPSTDDTASLIGAIVTLVTDAHQCARPHVGITDDTLSIT